MSPRPTILPLAAVVLCLLQLKCLHTVNGQGMRQRETPTAAECAELLLYSSADSTHSDRGQAAERPADDLDFLLGNSTLVFLGALRETRPFHDPDRNVIVTTSTFYIEDVIIGDFPNTELSLHLIGGTLGEETLLVSHMPHLQRDQRYIVFTDPRRTVYNPITGNDAGVFIVEPDGQAVHSSEGLAVTGVHDGVLQLAASPRGAETDLEPGGRKALPVELEASGELRVIGRDAGSETAKAMSYEDFARVIQCTANY